MSSLNVGQAAPSVEAQHAINVSRENALKQQQKDKYSEDLQLHMHMRKQQ